MKCKVCGYEFDDSRNNCPMCGTPVENASGAPVEMKWNTRDFPKPQSTVEDIQMRWSNAEISEGYVSAPEKPKRQFSPNNQVNPAYNQPETPASQSFYKDPDAQRVPRVEDGRLPEKFYTFQTKNEEFQRLLDKEFERLKELQSQLPESKSFPLPGTEPERVPVPEDDFDRMLLDDTADAAGLSPEQVYKDAVPAAPKVRAEDSFDIQNLENSIRLIREEEEIAQKESEERLRKLAAMKAARDAYFKSLDEAEAKKPSKNFFWWDRDTAKPEPVKPAEKPEPEKNVPAYETPALEDLTGSLDEEPEHTIQFVKEEFVAAQDALLRELLQSAAAAQPVSAVSEAEQAPIAAEISKADQAPIAAEISEADQAPIAAEIPAVVAAAAVAASFSSEETDTPDAEPAQPRSIPADTEEELPKHFEAEADLPERFDNEASDFSEDSDDEADLPEFFEDEEDDPEAFIDDNLDDEPTNPEELSSSFEKNDLGSIATQTFKGLAGKEAPIPSDDIFEDYDPSANKDDDEQGRHPFLKFLGLVILILVMVQVAVFGLEKLLPNASFTKTLVQIASSVQEACDEFLATAIQKAKEIFN